MMFKTALATLAIVTAAAASCALSKEGHGWELYVYGQTNCGKGNHWEEFWGAPSVCQCYEIAPVLNNKVKSFVFTSKSNTVTFFDGAFCGGDVLGEFSDEFLLDRCR